MTPYDEGMVAASQGLNEDHNPYAEGTSSHSEWLRGLNDYVGPGDVDDPDDDNDD